MATEIELPFDGLHLGDVDVKVADGIGLEAVIERQQRVPAESDDYRGDGRETSKVDN